MSQRIREMAEAFMRARTDLQRIEPLHDDRGLASVEEAYAVQSAANRLWLERGRRRVGHQIGLTSASVQTQLGIDQPEFEMLWADYPFTEGEVIDTGRFMQPKAELEVAFVMDHRFDDPRAPMIELIRHVAYAVSALEVVDSAIRNRKIHLVDTVADTASGGGSFWDWARACSAISTSGFAVAFCSVTAEPSRAGWVWTAWAARSTRRYG